VKETITRDDLTGRQSETTREVSIIFDDQEYTLDLESESVAALTALFADHDNRKLRDLLTTPVIATVEAERVTIKPTATDGEPTGKQINAWRKANGLPVSRGKPTKEMKAQYIKAQKG
jgi:hypothetical protein